MKYLISVFLVLIICGCQKKQQEAEVVDEVSLWEKTVKESPSFDNYISYGLVLGKNGKGQEALAAYQKASQINPKAPIAWNNMCFELANQNRLQEAEQHCQKALSIEPNFQLAKNNLEHVKSKIDNLKKQAIQAKANLMNNPKRSSQAVIDTGMNFYSLNEFQEAVAVWEMIRPEEEQYAIAQNNIASSFIRMGQLKFAEQALKKALSLDANNQLFKNNQAWLEDEKNKQK